MLMSSDKVETAVYGCHFPDIMAVSMREVLARPLVGECAPCFMFVTLYLNPKAWKIKATQEYTLSKPKSLWVTDLLHINIM